MFSVSMNMLTHMATSYLDIRIRLHLKRDNRNFHLLAIQMLSRHTKEQILLRAAKSLDVLAPYWRNMIGSISTGGERKMTGRVQGVVPRFEQATLRLIYRILYGPHQLAIKLQRFFASLMNEDFSSSLRLLITY